MPRPGKCQRSQLSERESPPPAAPAPPRALTASAVAGRALLPLLILRRATLVDAGTQGMASPPGSRGAKRPCAY